MALKRPAEAAMVDGDWRNKQSFRPKKICRFFLEGRCQKGTTCTYAHDEQELHPETANIAMSQAMQEQHEHTQGRRHPMDGPGGFDPKTSEIENSYSEIRHPWTKDALLGPDGDAAEGEEIGRCLSSLEGPRDFFGGSVPRQMCSLWLRHPVLCEAGDSCPLAHGLMEMGLDDNTGARIQCSGDESPANVQVIQAQVQPQQHFGCAKGKSSAPSPYGQGLGMAYGGKGAGKAGSQVQGGGKAGGYKGKKGGAVAMPALTAGGKGGAMVPSPGGKGMTLPSRFAEGGGFKPMKLCQFWVENPQACTKGDACMFAHGAAELNPAAVATCGISRFHNTGFSPTELCRFSGAGQCEKGLRCTYAHSVEELRK